MSQLMSHEQIAAGIAQVRLEIQRAAERSGRDPSTVSLMLVTKTVDSARVATAVQAGRCLLGENRVQELASKAPEVDRLLRVAGGGDAAGPKWHMIGHLQTNKVKALLGVPGVAMIQSLDRLALAAELDRRLLAMGKSLPVLVQVNTSGEPSKSGVAPEECLPFLRSLSAYVTLEVRGLMTIGAHTDDADRIRACFRLLRELRDRVADEGLSHVRLEVLSMGMSGDFGIAVEEGSTLVRVGSAVFGRRA